MSTRAGETNGDCRWHNYKNIIAKTSWLVFAQTSNSLLQPELPYHATGRAFKHAVGSPGQIDLNVPLSKSWLCYLLVLVRQIYHRLTSSVLCKLQAKYFAKIGVIRVFPWDRWKKTVLSRVILSKSSTKKLETVQARLLVVVFLDLRVAIVFLERGYVWSIRSPSCFLDKLLLESSRSETVYQLMETR